MAQRKQNISELSEDIGVAKYSRDEDMVLEVEQKEDAMIIVAAAVNAHHRRVRRSTISTNYHHGNSHPKERAPRLVLPQRMDPHRPVIQLARAATQDFGFRSVASMNTTVPLTSNRGVELADKWVNWIEGVNKRGAPNADPGLIILVERSEDDENPRLHQLRQSIGDLAVPYLTVVTAEDPNSAPLYADLSLDSVSMTPELPTGSNEFKWLDESA